MKQRKTLVYSTAKDRICNDCHLPWGDCICRKIRKEYEGKETLKIRREIKGRKGKTITSISGVNGDETRIKDLAKELKQAMGTGGSVKDGIILIQGDHRKKIIEWLTRKGHTAKLAGG